jgi:hypothetical protein
VNHDLIVFLQKLGLAELLFWPSWIVFILLREKRMLDYIKTPFKTALYFLCFSFIPLFVFSKDYLSLNIAGNIFFPLTFLFACVLLTIFLYAYGRTNFTHDRSFDKASLHTQHMQLSYVYIFSKSFDILYQQVNFILGIVLINDLLHSTFFSSTVSSVIFGSLHLALFSYLYLKRKLPQFTAIAFSIIPFFGGFIMAYVVLAFPFGFLYSFGLHLLYYPILGLSSRWYFGKKDLN